MPLLVTGWCCLQSRVCLRLGSAHDGGACMLNSVIVQPVRKVPLHQHELHYSFIYCNDKNTTERT